MTWWSNFKLWLEQRPSMKLLVIFPRKNSLARLWVFRGTQSRTKPPPQQKQKASSAFIRSGLQQQWTTSLTLNTSPLQLLSRRLPSSHFRVSTAATTRQWVGTATPQQRTIPSFHHGSTGNSDSSRRKYWPLDSVLWRGSGSRFLEAAVSVYPLDSTSHFGTVFPLSNCSLHYRLTYSLTHSLIRTYL